MSTVKRACSFISWPWSQVMERRSSVGSFTIVLASALRTASPPCAVGEAHEHDVAGGALDQGADGPPAGAHDEVSFPVAGHGPVLDLGGTLGDHHHVADLALARRLALSLGAAHGPALAQTAKELLAQGSSALHEQRHVDGLVRHPHLRVVGERLG